MAVEVAYNAEDKKFMDFSNTPGRHYTAKAKPEVEVRRCAMTEVQLLRENSKSQTDSLGFYEVQFAQFRGKSYKWLQKTVLAMSLGK